MLKVLVTGGAGFIGSHLVDQLLAARYEPVVVDDLRTGKLSNLPGGVTCYQADVLSEEFERIVRDEQPQYVCHLAAQTSVAFSLRDPNADATNNILGSIKVLESCRKCRVKEVVFTSSAAVYGNPQRLPIDEAHPIAPLSPYGISKSVAEQYTRTYQLTYRLPCAVLRCANVYGPRQDTEGEAGVVAIFLSRMLRGEQALVEGDGEQTRDFIYVEDVASAHVAAIQADAVEQPLVLNIGTGQEVTVNQLFEAAAELTGYSRPRVHVSARKGDIRRSVLDCRQAETRLGWKAVVPLNEGLAKTTAYFQG